VDAEQARPGLRPGYGWAVTNGIESRCLSVIGSRPARHRPATALRAARLRDVRADYGWRRSICAWMPWGGTRVAGIAGTRAPSGEPRAARLAWRRPPAAAITTCLCARCFSALSAW